MKNLKCLSSNDPIRAQRLRKIAVRMSLTRCRGIYDE